MPISAAIVLLLFCAATRTAAWWSGGHQLCTRAAVQALPDDMPKFFREGVLDLSEMSTEADNWKHATAPHLKTTEQPEHFIDLEYLGNQPIPERRFDLAKIYVQQNVDLNRGGFLPYAIQEGYERLMLAFREHRNRPEAESVKRRILVYAGWLAHYCQDAAMPLHTTRHFDGRPGANGTLEQKGIHARIDSYPEQNGFTPEMLCEGLKIESTPAIFPLIVAQLRASHEKVNLCYELDRKGAFQERPEAGRELMLACTRAGTKLTAQIWYSAWVNSAPEKAGIR